METKLTKLSRGYAAALRKYLKQGPGAGLELARALRRQAGALGVETRDLARIHEVALARLVSPSDLSGAKRGVIRRAVRFFAEAAAPIEKTRRGIQETKVLLNRLNGRVDLAASSRSLKQGIIQRKAVEKALEESGQRFTRLLKESRRLQKHLRHQTHRIMSSQEDERKKISRELHDEVAQTLLGINVRLLSLKKGATVNVGGLKKEIASTERLVKESIRSINRFAHDLDIYRHA